MSRATHSGHCQACGSLQKLPKSVLSLHGYKVTHGYFSGICPGAHHPPFEVSCDLVKIFVANAQNELNVLQDYRAILEAKATNPKAWVHLFYSAQFLNSRFSKHQWEEVTMAVRVDGAYLRYSFTDALGREHGQTLSDRITGVQPYEPGYTTPEAALLETCSNSNRTYSRWLEHEAQSLRRYIAWQTDRVATWAPAPLLPNDAKDKAAFVPTAAAY